MTDQVERIIRQEIRANVSYLVSTLANGEGVVSRAHTRLAQNQTDLADLCEQAMELASPILDWEEAARQEGWRYVEEANAFHNENEADHLSTVAYSDWEDLCLGEVIDPYEREVYEHWLVSSWLAEKLLAIGEKVDTDFAGLCVWARTVTGQSIELDGTIQKVVAKTQEAA